MSNGELEELLEKANGYSMGVTGVAAVSPYPSTKVGLDASRHQGGTTGARPVPKFGDLSRYINPAEGGISGRAPARNVVYDEFKKTLVDHGVVSSPKVDADIVDAVRLGFDKEVWTELYHKEKSRAFLNFSVGDEMDLDPMDFSEDPIQWMADKSFEVIREEDPLDMRFICPITKQRVTGWLLARKISLSLQELQVKMAAISPNTFSEKTTPSMASFGISAEDVTIT
jgi:hypothetical protein